MGQSYLAGVGIRSTINAGLTHDFMPDVIWGSITQGLLQGVTNIGLNFATEELGISPLLANIGFSAISGAINAGIQAATGGSQDVFQSLFNTYTDNALTFLGYGDPSNVWQQSAYISQILDFSNIVQERGLVEALNSYGAGFFNAVAVNQIVQSGMSIGQYFATKLAAGQYTTRTLQDGTQVKEVAVTDGQNITANAFFQQKQVGEDTYWDLIGGEEFIGGDSYLGWGNFGVDAYGKLGYTDATLYSIFDSDIQYQQVISGQQAYAEVKDLQGNTLLIIEPTAGGSYNTYNSYGEYIDAKIADYSQPLNITLKGGFIEYCNSRYNSNHLYEGDIQRLSEYGFTVDDLYNAQVSLTTSSDGTASRTLYWSAYEHTNDIWTKLSESGIWATVQERFDNASQWLGFRTTAEIQQHRLDEYQKLSTMGQTGDIIFVNGTDAQAYATKEITRGPVNHVGILYIDSNGEKWVIEMLVNTDMQKISLADFMERQENEGNDIKIGRRYNVSEGELQSAIKENLFDSKTGELKHFSYNIPNLFGINGSDERSFICSGLVEYVYRKAGKPIFAQQQLQYSPVDIYKEIDKIGYKY